MTTAQRVAVRFEEVPHASLPAIAQLMATVFREEFDLPVEDLLAKEVERHARGSDPALGLVLAALASDRVVGALLGHRDGANIPFTFRWLGVVAAWRGCGVGHGLLNRGLTLCQERGISPVRARALAASPVGPRLFWSCGFKVTDVVSRSVGGRPREVIVFARP